jgi:hypothetical protein
VDLPLPSLASSRSTYPGLVTVAAGRAPSVRSLRWLVVVGALFAVAMFGHVVW